MAVAGLVVVAVIVVALLVLTSGGGGAAHSSSTAPISNAPTKVSRHAGRAKVVLKPSAVTVAVLNGTATPNLAHDVALKLGSAGYKQGRIATATDQTQTATVVGYLPGQRRAALLVARSLGLGPASVQTVDQNNQAVACPQGTTCAVQVVVTVGSDLSSSAGSTTAASTST